MNPATLLWRNLWRNPRRTGLTLASLAISLFLFTLLAAALESLQTVARSSAEQLRLVVRDKSTLTRLLPLGDAGRIAALPGVRAVCGVRWFGGRLPDSAAQFPSLAVDAATAPAVYTDFALSADELQTWSAERTAALVGEELARRMGWTRGGRVTLRGTVPPFARLEFRIAGITAAPTYANFFIFRLDYLLDAIRPLPGLSPRDVDGVNFFWVKASTPEASATLRGQVDALFAGSSDPTRTEPEEAFIAQFVRMFGDVPRILEAVGLAVLAAVLLVSANTIALALRERASELAVLRALGYPPARLVRAILAESAAVGLLGGLLGCLPAGIASGLTASGAVSIPYLPGLQVSGSMIGLGLLAGAGLGLAAGVLPALLVVRAPIARVLRAGM